MLKTNNLLHKTFNYFFCSKKIIVSTETTTRQLRFSCLFQLLFLIILSSIVSYFAVKYNRYKNYRNYALILAENDRLRNEQEQLKNEFKKYEKKANKINEYLKVREAKKPEKINYKNLTNDEIVAILDDKTKLAYEAIDERKKNISKFIKKIGIQKITYNKLIKTAKVSENDAQDAKNLISNVSDQTSIGGVEEQVENIKIVKDIPFLQVSSKNITDKNYEKELNDIIAVEKTLQSLPFGTPTSGKYRLTSTYGFRKDPLKKDGKIRLHRGIDMVLDNQDVITPKSGKVIFAGVKTGYGNCVDIEHQIKGVNNKIITHYAHLKKIFVEKGQIVDNGEIIGIQGSTGRSTGPHLHYEIQINGQSVNPINFIRVKSDI